MHPPINPGIWQASAHVAGQRGIAIASARTGSKDDMAKGHAFPEVDALPNCTLSQLLRSGPQRGRPGLWAALRRASADLGNHVRLTRAFVFRVLRFAIFSGHEEQPSRSSELCPNPYSPLRFWPSPRLPAACRTRRRAVWPVPSPVLPSLTRWTKTWSPVPRWAALPVLQAATSWAAATDLTSAACGRSARRHGPSGLNAPVAFSISAPRPGRGARGERCSRRS